MENLKDSYGEVDDDDWGWVRTKENKKRKNSQEMFIPEDGSEIARYKTVMCNYITRSWGCVSGIKCRFAHTKEEIRKYGSPMPVFVKKLFLEEGMTPSIYSSKLHGKYKDLQAINSTGSLNTDDSDIKTFRQNPLSIKLSKLEKEYTDLIIENKEINEKYQSLSKTNDSLVMKLSEYSKIEEQLYFYKSKVNSLEAENANLKTENDSLKNSSSEEILKSAIKELENITMSPLTDKPMSAPSLTPSLDLVDKEEIFSILDKDPDHMFLTRAKLYKGMVFQPMQRVVDLKSKIKMAIRNKKIETAETRTRDVSTEATGKFESPKRASTPHDVEIKSLNEDKMKLITKIQDLTEIIGDLEMKCKEYEIDRLIESKESSKVVTQRCENRLKQMIEKINDLLVCPQSSVKIGTPIILPSGFTVDQLVADKLIEKKRKDPFDSNLKVKSKTVNRFAVRVKEIISEFEKSTLKN